MHSKLTQTPYISQRWPSQLTELKGFSRRRGGAEVAEIGRLFGEAIDGAMDAMLHFKGIFG